MPKQTERRNPLGFSNIHSVAKHQKNAGGPFEGKKFRKKIPKKNVSQCRKKLKGGTLWSLPRYGMLRGKTGKTILVQFAMPNGAI